MNYPFDIRSKEASTFDVLVLGEVLLRFDPGESRIRTARSFTVSEGGGEYNVGRAVRKVFGKRTALVTAIGDNELGLLLDDLLHQGGLNLDFVVRKSADDLGHSNRNPTYFAERGFGVRAPRAIYDRASSAASSLRPDDIDWDYIFGTLGVRWFHTGGIFAGLSDHTTATVEAAMTAAKRHGTIVSYDINYRPKLWNSSTRAADGIELARQLADSIDVLFGVQDVEDRAWLASTEGASSPKVIATTQRTVLSASEHGLVGQLWSNQTGPISSQRHEHFDVFDRIGSGDAFAAGLINGILDGIALNDALEVGTALAVLTTTTPGDTAASDIAEIQQLINRLPPDISR